MTVVVTGVSPANAPGFTFDGRHSSEFGIYLLRHSFAGMPATADAYKEIPGRHGVYDFGFRFEGRRIELPCFVLAQSESDLRRKMREIAAWLDPSKGERQLILDTEPDKYYMARVSGSIDVEIIARQGRMIIPFLASDPHAYAVAEKRRTIAAVSASFSRASVAYKSDGTQVASGQPRFETVNGRTGVLVEEGTTNLIRNSTGQGGGGSTLPTNWSLEADAGLSWSVNVADDMLSGHKYVDLTIQNTSGTTKNLRLYFEAIDAITASSGQTFVLSAILYVVNGSLPIQVGVGFHWYNSSKSYIGENKTAVFISTSRTRYASAALTAPANTAYARPRIDLYGIPNGAAFTLRIVAPQAEQKAYATSYVATTGTTATRAAETLTVPTAVWNKGNWTVDVGWVPTVDTSKYGAFRRILSVWINDQNRYEILCWNTNGRVYGTVRSNGTWYDCGPTVGPVAVAGTHYLFTLRGDGSVLAFFSNGVKLAEVTYAEPIGTPTTIRLGDQGPGGHPTNGVFTALRISNIARSDAEIAAAYAAGTLTVDEYTTALYTFDGTLKPTNNQTVTNDGTAAAYPVIRAYVQRPTTFLAVATPDRQIILGKPDNVEATPVERETRILYDQLTTTTGWTTGTVVDGGVVTGTMYSDGADFRVQDYGSGSAWHGPALKKSLPELLTDFRLTVWVTLKNRSGKVGRAEVYLLDQNGAVIGKMALVDRHANIDDVWAEVRAGSLSDGVYFVNTHGVRAGVWNDFYGVLQLQRTGNVWRAFIGMFDTNTRQYHTRWTAQYVDVHNQFAAKLAQVQLHAATYSAATPCDVIFHAVVVDRINTVQDTQIPYIAMPGDEIEIDCERAVVRKNGMVDLSLLDVSSRFPYLQAKTGTTFGVAPEDTAIVEITFRERWL